MIDPNAVLQSLAAKHLRWLFIESPYWTVFGLLGNALFSSRFFLQWLQSERKKRLTVPRSFWHLSFWGSVVCLIYAIHLANLPIILAYGFLPVIYARNLILLRRSSTPLPLDRTVAKPRLCSDKVAANPSSVLLSKAVA